MLGVRDKSAIVARPDTNAPEDVTLAQYLQLRQQMEPVLPDKAVMPEEVPGNRIRRATLVHGRSGGLSAHLGDRRLILDLSDPQVALAPLIEILTSLTVDRSGGEGKLYKPAVVFDV